MEIAIMTMLTLVWLVGAFCYLYYEIGKYMYKREKQREEHKRKIKGEDFN